MIKKIIRWVISNCLALVLTSYLIEGFNLELNPITILSASLILMLVQLIVRPVIRLISFPLNVVTLGFFEFIVNLLLLYLVVFLIDGLTIEPGYINLGYFGVIMKEIPLPSKFTVLVASATSISIINWLLRLVIF